jgi:hypothetical protein
MLCKFTKLDIHFQKDRCALCYAFTYVWNNDAICISFGMAWGLGQSQECKPWWKDPSLARRDSLFEKDHSMLFTWFVQLCNFHDNLFHMVCAFVQFPWQFVSHGLCSCAIFDTNLMFFTWFVQFCNFHMWWDVELWVKRWACATTCLNKFMV